jgi:hypothetical protein
MSRVHQHALVLLQAFTPKSKSHSPKFADNDWSVCSLLPLSTMQRHVQHVIVGDVNRMNIPFRMRGDTVVLLLGHGTVRTRMKDSLKVRRTSTRIINIIMVSQLAGSVESAVYRISIKCLLLHDKKDCLRKRSSRESSENWKMTLRTTKGESSIISRVQTTKTQSSIYIELADQYKEMDAASNVRQRNTLAKHLREVVDILEQKVSDFRPLQDNG